MRKSIICSILGIFLLTGCVKQEPIFVGEPTPTLVLAASTIEPLPTIDPQDIVELPQDDLDVMGAKIEGDEHFLQYLSFQNVRVYEYAGGTLMDGICQSDYPEALTGSFVIYFYDERDQLISQAEVYSRDGDGLYHTGENIIYAEIDTDTDVQMMRFELVMQQRIWPKTMIVATIE